MSWRARIARRLRKGEALLCEDFAALGLEQFGDHDPDRCQGPEEPYCGCIEKPRRDAYIAGDLSSGWYDQRCERISTAEAPDLRLRFCCGCAERCDDEGLSGADLLSEVRGLLIEEGLLEPRKEAA